MKQKEIDLYRELIGGTIAEILLCVFPPLYEESIANADISIHLLLNDGRGFTLDTDSNLWSCTIREESLDYSHFFAEFESRMKFWMADNDAENQPLEKEFFKIEASDKLGSLIGAKIVRIEFLNIESSSEFNPHGVKIHLDNGQSIISTCGHDGNIVQTNHFLNDIDLIDRFQDIGVTKLVELGRVSD